MLASIGYFGFGIILNTGDLKTIRDLYPKIQKYLDIWQKNNDGTITFRAGEWTWGDWEKILISKRSLMLGTILL